MTETYNVAQRGPPKTSQDAILPAPVSEPLLYKEPTPIYDGALEVTPEKTEGSEELKRNDFSAPRYTRWIERQRRLLEHEYDLVVVFVGRTGNGKSSAAWWWGHSLDPDFHAGRMHFQQKYFMQSGQHPADGGPPMEGLMDAAPGSVVVHDEFREGGDAYETMSKESKQILRYLDVCRARRIAIGLCIPALRWANIRVRDDRADYLVHVKARGLAVVHRPIRPSPLAVRDWQTGRAYTRWVPFFNYRFPRPHGSDWELYEARKKRHVTTFDPTEGSRKKKS